jgi:hypothetical protein
MSWLFSQALVEAFSAATCSAGEPCAQLNVMPTAQPFWRNDKTMDASRFSRFGLTCAPLTADRGEALLTWFRAGFPARTSASPARATDSTESAADSGWKWPGSFAKWTRAASTWRTRQHSLLGGLDEFSETWPRWGSMRDGECSALPTLELTPSASASGLWPTPFRWRLDRPQTIHPLFGWYQEGHCFRPEYYEVVRAHEFADLKRGGDLAPRAIDLLLSRLESDVGDVDDEWEQREDVVAGEVTGESTWQWSVARNIERAIRLQSPSARKRDVSDPVGSYWRTPSGGHG